MNAIEPVAKATREKLEHLRRQLEDYKSILGD
jgi:hypothetical protein